MQRLDDGRPLREAAKRAGLTIPQLAEATRTADPEGTGVSQAYVGFLLGSGKSARNHCGGWAAELIATALETNLRELFTDDLPSTRTPTTTTTTVEMEKAMESSKTPEPLLTQKQLQDWLGKSRWWVDQMIAHQGLPVEWIRSTGRRRSRRFKESRVQAWLDADADAA